MLEYEWHDEAMRPERRYVAASAGTHRLSYPRVIRGAHMTHRVAGALVRGHSNSASNTTSSSMQLKLKKVKLVKHY